MKMLKVNGPLALNTYTAPSKGDTQYYKFPKQDFSLGKALITNGFTTVKIDSANFEKFNSH